MRAVLTILDGPLAGKTIELGPGESISVGRTAKSQLILPEDSFLSGMHFQVFCTESGSVIRDCGSSNGTFVNGQKIAEQLLADGDEIAAGQTRLSIRIGAPEPAGSATRINTVLFAVPKLEPTMTPEQQRVVDALKSQQAPVFALTDPAFETNEPYEALFEDLPSARFQTVSPGALPRLVREGWGKNCLVFLTTLHPPFEVWRHLRNYYLLHTDNGRQLRLRIQEPRLLDAFLAGVTPEEASNLFGPILSLIYEDDRDPARVIEVRNGPQGPVRRVV